MVTIIILIVSILSTGPLSAQAISKIMRNTIKCRAEQQNRWREGAELDEVKAYEPKKRNEQTLSYTELRDLISSHFKLDSPTTASETKDEDIVMGQCDGPSSEWVDIKIKYKWKLLLYL